MQLSPQPNRQAGSFPALITSLSWFNLSLKSLAKFRDTLDELGRIGRERRLLDEFLLEESRLDICWRCPPASLSPWGSRSTSA
jgi:hypothetical protein